MKIELLANNITELKDWLTRDARSLLPDELREKIPDTPEIANAESIIKKIYDETEKIATRRSSIITVLKKLETLTASLRKERASLVITRTDSRKGII